MLKFSAQTNSIPNIEALSDPTPTTPETTTTETTTDTQTQTAGVETQTTDPALQTVTPTTFPSEISNCEILTNNPYYDSAGANELLPAGQIYDRLRNAIWLCQKCLGGYLPALDRLTCIKPKEVSGCKAYSGTECTQCNSGFKKDINFYQDLAIDPATSSFDLRMFIASLILDSDAD